MTGAAPVWRDVMDYLHRGRAGRAPSAPDGVVKRQITYAPALEPERAEWFLAGTESAVIALVRDGQRLPKILYPGEASVIAVDPDMPRETERVVFHAQAGQGLIWRLNGQPLAAADADYAWRPVPGAYELALVDARQKVVASSRFQVRGNAGPAAL